MADKYKKINVDFSLWVSRSSWRRQNEKHSVRTEREDCPPGAVSSPKGGGCPSFTAYSSKSTRYHGT